MANGLGLFTGLAFYNPDETEEEMLSLGQIYIKPSQLTQLKADYGVTLGNVFVHELFHSVQFGYSPEKSNETFRSQH